MNLAIGIAIGIFILLWIWIAFEIKNAPTYDENGIKIDITEEDINGDLNCIYGKDEAKEDEVL